MIANRSRRQRATSQAIGVAGPAAGPHGHHRALNRQAPQGPRLIRRPAPLSCLPCRDCRARATYFDSRAKSIVFDPAFTSAVSVDRLLYFDGILGGGAAGAPPLEPSAETPSEGMSVGLMNTL